MTVVVIAEKPSVGRDLARVLGARGRADGYLEGNGYRVGWCVGHLLELASPEAYDPAWKRWSAATLPMLPDRFRVQARKGAGKQLAVLKRLLRGSDVARVVNACDAGREGELIFRWVWEHVFGDRRGPPVQRLWIASLTDAAIRGGFARLRSGASTDALAAAARCRSEADWLVGLNATRAMTLLGRRAGAGEGVLSVGRVQTPTLAMLAAREDAIEAFEPEPYWTVDATFDAGEGRATWAGRWHDGDTDRLTGPEGAARAAAIAQAVQGRAGQVVEVRHEEVRERPPPLFDLTALQKLANRRFGLSADRTLKAAQALYERHKAITYPRTDARFVTSDVAPTLPGLLRAQAGAGPWSVAVATALALGPRVQRKVVDDADVGDHHAILPTEAVPDVGRLGADERRVYELIARRFVAVFLPDAVFDTRRVVAVVQRHAFVAKGRVRRALGWHEAEPPPVRRDEPPTLPDVREGEGARVVGVEVAERRTQPPKRFTEATLLGAMENPGRDVTEEEVRRALRESGLGTPATRAGIIETLLTRGFIRREGKALVATAQGRALIAALPVDALRSPEMTGAWEARLSRMAEGREDPRAFMAEIRRFTTEAVVAMRGAEPPRALGAASEEREVLGACPLCGTAVTKGRKAYVCETGRACDFVIFERVVGKKISPGLVKLLLARGRSSALPGFRSKAGKRFSAALVLGEDGKVSLDFGGDPARGRSEGGGPKAPRAAKAQKTPTTPRVPPDGRPRCPQCRQGRVMAGRRAWGCTRWREGCGFVVSFDQGALRLPEDEAERLFRKRQTRLLDGLVDGARARLVLDLDAPGNVRVERGKR